MASYMRIMLFLFIPKQNAKPQDLWAKGTFVVRLNHRLPGQFRRGSPLSSAQNEDLRCLNSSINVSKRRNETQCSSLCRERNVKSEMLPKEHTCFICVDEILFSSSFFELEHGTKSKIQEI